MLSDVEELFLRTDEGTGGKEFGGEEMTEKGIQHFGARERNFSAPRPKGSMSRNLRRWESITWVQGLRAPKQSSSITSSQFRSTKVSKRARVTMQSCKIK